MTSNKKDPVLVVLQMTGAYDALNTLFRTVTPTTWITGPIFR